MTTVSPNAFDAALQEHNLGELHAAPLLTTLQINVGKLCNQACKHCHVDAGPNRTEMMTRETVEQALAVVRRFRISTMDITGGAPELNPNFDHLVCKSRQIGAHV